MLGGAGLGTKAEAGGWEGWSQDEVQQANPALFCHLKAAQPTTHTTSAGGPGQGVKGACGQVSLQAGPQKWLIDPQFSRVAGVDSDTHGGPEGPGLHTHMRRLEAVGVTGWLGVTDQVQCLPWPLQSCPIPRAPVYSFSGSLPTVS